MDFSNLPKTIESTTKIKDFLNVATSFDEILEASFYLAQIYESLEMYSEAISSLIYYLTEDVRKKYRDFYQVILDFIINVYIKTNNYDDAIKYIYKKRDSLPTYDIYKANLLLVDVLLLDDKKDDAIVLALSLLRDNLSHEEKVKIYKLLIEYYINYRNYDESLVYIRRLKEETFELDDSNYYYALYYEAYSSFMINEFITANKLNLECIDNRIYMSEDLIIKAYILDLRILVELKEYKKAILRESEYESIITSSTYENKKVFYETCIKLYTEQINKPSLELYEKRLLQLEKPIEVKKAISKKEIKIIKKEIKEISEEKEEKTISKNDSYKIVNSFNNLLENVIKDPIDFKLRRNILQILKETNKIVNFDVCVIIYNTNRLNGFYYKKDRLYEHEFKDLRNTIVYECIKDKKEHLFSLKSELKGYRDLYLEQQYEYTDIESLDCFPILEKGEVKAVIYYYSFDESLNLGFNYELLKLASLLVGDRINNISFLEDYSQNKDVYLNGFNNAFFPIKYVFNNKVYVNNVLKEMLDIPNEQSLNEFMIGMNPDYYKGYKEYLKSDIEEYKFQYKDKYYIERKKKIDDYIISTIKDETESVLKEKRENDLIYLDMETNTFNMYSFNRDIITYMNKEKFSLLYLNIKTYSKINELYGLDYAKRIIRNTARSLKEYLLIDSIYHLNRDEFIIVLDGINDLRTVEKKSLDLIEYLRLEVNKKSSRVEAKFAIGAVRYKSQTLIKNPDLLLDYAGYASKMANLSANSFAYYDQDGYKKYFDETALASNINEAIETNKISVSYNQVIDLTKMQTSFYSIKPTVSFLNSSSEEIYNIVNIRGLTIKFEIYLIRKAISEILATYNSTKKYIKISLKINYETILQESFIPLMKRLIIENKIPKGLIIFEIYGKRKDIKDKIIDLINMGIKFVSSKLEDVLLFDIEYFKVGYLLPHLSTQKGVDVLESLKLMTNSLNIKLIIDKIEAKDIKKLIELGIDYVSYGKPLLIEDILKQME